MGMPDVLMLCLLLKGKLNILQHRSQSNDRATSQRGKGLALDACNDAGNLMTT